MNIFEILLPKIGFNLHNYMKHVSSNARARKVEIGFFCWDDKYWWNENENVWG